MEEPEVLIFEDQQRLNETVANRLQQLAREAVEERGRFLLVLSGGSTPRPLFRLLAQAPYADDIPWAHTHIFWADERAVPPLSEESNYALAEELLLSQVPIPGEQIHRMEGELDDLLTAAERYTETLLRVAEENRLWPRFDLVLLGLGSDGHTASLFPGATLPLQEEQPVLAVSGSYDNRPPNRISLTPKAINSARHVFFLVTGGQKAPAVAATLQGPRDLDRYPAQRIQPTNGSIVWFIDDEAATNLERNKGEDNVQTS
jgi:6-phosphogluconolactonase